MKEYNGYLSLHVAKIKKWANDGHSATDIAHYLYDVEGVRTPDYSYFGLSPANQRASFAGIIRRCILKTSPKPEPKRKPKPKPEPDWWTPEREEMLIRAERGEH